VLEHPSESAAHIDAFLDANNSCAAHQRMDDQFEDVVGRAMAEELSNSGASRRRHISTGM